MEEKIRNFFGKKKLDKKFKRAGPGHKLTDESTSSFSSVKETKTPSVSSHEAGPSNPSAARAGAAALARMTSTKEVNWSLEAIRAQARKELELEQQAALVKEKRAELAPQIKEAAPQVSKENALLFSCPLIGEQVLPRKELLKEIRKFLFEEIKEEKGLSSALAIVTCNEDEATIKACVDLISKYLTNIIDHADEEKYRKIKFANKIFQERVHPVIGAIEFLEACGFERKSLDNETYLILSPQANLEMLSTLKEALHSAEPLDIELDRNLKVFLPSQAPTELNISEEYFNLTAAEISREQASRTKENELNQLLRTKAMRERDAKRGNTIYKYTLLRIRLPNGFILQGTFEVDDSLSAVYDFLNGSLLEECKDVLLKSGAQALTDHSRSLSDLHLIPACVLNCLLDAPPNSDILRPELLTRVERL